MNNQKVFSFKDDNTLDQILEQVLLKHSKEFKDKSDLLRKSCHFLLRTLGYEWPEKAEKPVDAQSPKAEGESAISEVFTVHAKR